METARSEKAPGEKVICLFPGCDKEAVESSKTKDNAATRQGPPPRYCGERGAQRGLDVPGAQAARGGGRSELRAGSSPL